MNEKCDICKRNDISLFQDKNKKWYCREHIPLEGKEVKDRPIVAPRPPKYVLKSRYGRSVSNELFCAIANELAELNMSLRLGGIQNDVNGNIKE